MEDYFEEFSEEFSKWENIKDLAEQEISKYYPYLPFYHVFLLKNIFYTYVLVLCI